jgi:hypothetical protein
MAFFAQPIRASPAGHNLRGQSDSKTIKKQNQKKGDTGTDWGICK